MLCVQYDYIEDELSLSDATSRFLPVNLGIYRNGGGCGYSTASNKWAKKIIINCWQIWNERHLKGESKKEMNFLCNSQVNQNGNEWISMTWPFILRLCLLYWEWHQKKAAATVECPGMTWHFNWEALKCCIYNAATSNVRNVQMTFYFFQNCLIISPAWFRDHAHITILTDLFKPIHFTKIKSRINPNFTLIPSNFLYICIYSNTFPIIPSILLRLS